MNTLKMQKNSSSKIAGDEAKVYSPELQAKITRLAYFRAEKRGFSPGHEIEDWLVAEREAILQEHADAYAGPGRT